MENLCGPPPTKGGAGGDVIKFTPTQDFIRHYFKPCTPVKGMLLYHSVGTGKTCTAIAAATSTFELEDYTILWVTRTTLKNDIWKNMFDQVCHESIRNKITHSSMQMPNEQTDRMRILSKSWRIRPMSYKQFSNLVSKKNNLYNELVKINGAEDPLCKTLLIIDEAHKLYGESDLSTIERPDMNKLAQSLMHSYQTSGKNSVKLLLMTATPITQNPMELIQLLNLCKPINEQMPSSFNEFSNHYLDTNGKFTDSGRSKYLNDIAGYVSYLNRERDARQFSQPQIEYVYSPIIPSIEKAVQLDKAVAKAFVQEELAELKTQVEEKSKIIDVELARIDKNSLSFLKEKCSDLSPALKKKCEAAVSKNIAKLIKDTKEKLKESRNEIKEIKKVIKEKESSYGKIINQNKKTDSDEYLRFKDSMYYNLKNRCGEKIADTKNLFENIKETPEFKQDDNNIQERKERIKDLQNGYKEMMNSFKTEINEMKAATKDRKLTPEKRNSMMQELQRRMNEIDEEKKNLRDELTQLTKHLMKEIKLIKNTRKKNMKNVEKTIKTKIKDMKKADTVKKRDANKIKVMLKRDEIQTTYLKDLVKTYEEGVEKEMEIFQKINANNKQKEAEKDAEKKRKEEEKQRKAEEKDAEKKRKEEEKDAEKKRKEEEKQRKAEEKDAEKKRKEAEKEHAKQTKKAEQERSKMEKQNARKTQKTYTPKPPKENKTNNMIRPGRVIV